MDVLGIALDKHSKSNVSKHSSTLADVFIRAYDLRRETLNEDRVHDPSEFEQLDRVEQALNEKALKIA